MVRASKNTTTPASTPAPAVVATPAPAVVASAPVEAKKVAKKEKKVATPAPVTDAPVADASVVAVAPSTPATETPATETPSVTYSSVINEISAQLQQISSLVSSVKNSMKVAEKLHAKEQKLAQKSSRVKKSSGNKSPSGFTKPTLISDEFAAFIGKSAGTEMSRTEISKELHKYIKAHNLQLESNRRTIVPDAKLANLLKIKENNELNYFNLQKYISNLIKPTAPATA